MRLSLRILVPGTITVLFLVGGLLLVLVSSYFSYQHANQGMIEERITDLRIIKNTLYSQTIYYRATLGAFGLAETKRSFIKEMAGAPGIVFLRIVQPLSGKVLVSNREEEIGQVFKDLPLFTLEPSLRQSQWQGEKILEISMQGAANENLWLGITLKPIKKAALRMAFQTAILVFFFTAIIGSSLYFVFRQVILKPLLLIFQTIEEIRRGNLEIEAPVVSKTEIGELAAIFNETIKDLRKSRLELEEAKTVLEIKVAARTKELRELVQQQEEIIKERTKEIQKRVEELEKFQRLAVGRELKMIELKRALRKSQAEVKKLREAGKND